MSRYQEQQRQEQLHMHIQDLISHYLKQNNHLKTLKQFEIELNRPLSTPQQDEIDEELSSIVKDRINFTKLIETQLRERENNSGVTLHQLEIIRDNKLSLPRFKIPFPDKVDPFPIQCDSLVLDVRACNLQLSSNNNDKTNTCLLFTCADKRIIVYDVEREKKVCDYQDDIANRLILGYKNRILACNMNGSFQLFDLDFEMDKLVKKREESFKLHSRIITSLKIVDLESETFLISIGFDFKLCINRWDHIDSTTTTTTTTGENQGTSVTFVDSVKFMSNPTCMEIHVTQQGQLLIFVGLLESSLVSVFTLIDHKLVKLYRIALNDAEFNNYSFHPTSMMMMEPPAVGSNNQEGLLIVGTNHIPYMRLLTVMVPEIVVKQKDTDNDDDNDYNIGEIKRDLVVSNINTMSIQDKYSSSVVLQRPGLGGVAVVGLEGSVRGVDIERGDVVEMASLGRNSTCKTATAFWNNEGEEQMVICAVDRGISWLRVLGEK